MNEINRERFEAWLFDQSNSRPFVYIEGASDSQTGCLLCNWFRDMGYKNFGVGGDYFWIGQWSTDKKLPSWFSDLWAKMHYPNKFTAEKVKNAYITLFGHPFPNESLGTEHVAPVCSSHGVADQPSIELKSACKT